MRKIFRFLEGRLPSPAARSAARRPLRRALLFAGGLILLWLAVRLAPLSPPDAPPVYGDAAGTLASNPQRVAPSGNDGLTLFTFGNMAALLLLAGGVAFAVHLRRRSPVRPHTDALLRPVGDLQLAPNQQLRLVACGGDVLLLGVTAGEISLLHRYPEDAFAPSAAEAVGGEGDGALPPASPTPTRPPDFLDLLRHATSNTRLQ